MVNKISKVVFFLFFSLSVVYSVAQQSNISVKNLSNVKVDELSDDQIKQFMGEFKNSGYSVEQIEKIAIQRKMPTTEAQKLRARIEQIVNTSEPAETEISRSTTETSTPRKTPKQTEKRIFGDDLFNTTNLTFEPNLKIATPANYMLGPDDELVIDIYGYNEATYKLKVTPEGYIRIPIVGPVQVAGSTIEQAKRKIITQLRGIYSEISQGNTSVNITLGAIRSIKIHIIGEVNTPGTYTLPSLATVFNALYASGGPNQNGSFRNIMIIRNGKPLANIDIYDFLMKGELKNNIRLNDQDVIKIPAYETRVELVGEIKRPAFYECKSGEPLSALIKYAGGYTDVAYKERIKVTRNTGKEKSVADIPNEMLSMFIPQTGDVFEIGKIISRYENRVIINGAVFRPGTYALEQGMTLSKLIKKADGLKEDAFTTRAIVYRLLEDNSTEIISVDLNEILNGSKDIELKREDMITINSKLALKEEYNIEIKGEVLNPGKYPYAENARVEDLIVAAGGLKENASRKKIEIARRFMNDGSVVSKESATIINYEVTEDLKNTKDIHLEPFDLITVYSIPGYSTQKTIRIEGEVNYPGVFAISSKTDKISDVLKRAGGANDFAFINGATLIRTKQLTEAEKIIRQQKIEALTKETKDTTRLQAIIDREVGSLTTIVGIDLKKVLDNPGSKYDLLVEDGDLISIPSVKQTVKVSGEVLYPVRIPYSQFKSCASYIRGSGGYSQRALKKRTYVVYANGSAKASKRFLFITFHPKIKPGAEIIVPTKQERQRTSVSEIVGIATSITTLMVLVLTLTK
ncbi:MAG: SLBB domain-containing protein [Bacteroidia bacterium]|nr:SLBB domain-containing protein [Bacteroidia bacterium]MCZ2140093.1 SLBB domain-containing protein [Bacteroidia bacterium]